MAVEKRGWVQAISALFVTNWITLFGSSLTTASAIAIIGFLILGALNVVDALYVGIVAFLILPGFFVAGLLLIPIGAWWERRRRHRAGVEAPAASGPRYPTIDFNRPEVRRMTGVVGGLTFVNLLIMSTVSYRGVQYMETPEFCGLVCHSVMAPEHTSYVNSPHARVDCVECHIGPGAPWFVRSKLSGVGQVFAVMFNTYEHPIPTPVENLRPSQDTCEQCHWPERFTGDRVRVNTHFAEDEANTATKNVLLLHIGGGALQAAGIHSWHIDPNKETVYYAADRERQDIRIVHVIDKKTGAVTEYKAPSADGKEVTTEGLIPRRMDCIDCHNRPTHIFQTPNEALNDALDAGLISADLPYIKQVGVETLREATGEPGDLERIGEKVTGYYRENYADRFDELQPLVTQAVATMQEIYRRNIFPQMDVTWGTYRSHLGHPMGEEGAPGCFRCHDDSHATETGEVIRQDCGICHTMLAMDEENPEVLVQLGLAEPPVEPAEAAPDAETPEEVAPETPSEG